MASQPQGDAALPVARDDLPVFCPNPKMPLWASHPRVYLLLDERGEARCPYCGTVYRLQESVDN
ncbi:MAG TPA: zinc-finger domain-containing protein [Casimicrobiaceae bacterium]|nr:zinc-finger domain-containing protein [Casimicrobiaceae bacterium]